ncbi:MAG: FAD-dependent oxidoreductase [Bacteroidetes bacterium]|nr:FAD-dependent oxidoreductase [Bacteroidota bacterium]
MPPEEAASEQRITATIRRQLKLSSSDSLFFSINKRSIDARARDVKVRLFVSVSINEKLPDKKIEGRHLQNISSAKPVVIIGCGPAGMFAALRLIELGFKPIIIERGKNVKDRKRDIAVINKQGIINPDSNYCFGEGGAGTYSDGKLYTRSGKRGNIQKILETFIQFGAHTDIAIDAHPHIGTNKLPGIIENIRKSILECGGEILFNTKFISFDLSGNTIKGIKVKSNLNENKHSIKADAVILATGHSARDIYEYFHNNNFQIEAKPFALGVRIEHPQSIIDSAQYHCETRNEFLPPASYSLVSQQNNKGIYSFCMCPGGIIAPSATAPGEVVLNGWSPSKRNNPFANSGIVVSVDEKDFSKFSKYGALASLRYQQDVEKKAFELGGGNLKAPAQRMADFVNKKVSSSLPKCSYLPGVASADLYSVLSKEISSALQFALKDFGRKMKGYFTNEAVLVATESRTSSPVRIPRDSETLMHTQLAGLFPCAEGAGYAGGIVSAAMDGERCAEAVKYCNL